MTLSLIVAMSQNRVIGKDNSLPWHLSEDLKRFKQLTMGHPIIMGRKTFESIGKPLPGRENIVITRSQDFKAEGVSVVHELPSSPPLKNPPPLEKGGWGDLSNVPIPSKGVEGGFSPFIIGGAEIFRLALPKADKIYLTLIEKDFDGDTFMPEFEKGFREIEKTEIKFSEKEKLPYRFITYHR